MPDLLCSSCYNCVNVKTGQKSNPADDDSTFCQIFSFLGHNDVKTDRLNMIITYFN